MSSIKSKAGRVLADPEQNAESRSLAAYVLGDDAPKPTRSAEELNALLTKISGMEGQHERVQEVRRQLASLGIGS